MADGGFFIHPGGTRATLHGSEYVLPESAFRRLPELTGRFVGPAAQPTVLYISSRRLGSVFAQLGTKNEMDRAEHFAQRLRRALSERARG